MSYQSSFSGFTPQTFQFLQELAINNNRPWFEAHRKQYIQVLQAPFQQLVIDLYPIMRAIDPFIEVREPKKSISRIYRDLRFSKDKSPFRSNMWLSFRRKTKDWKQDPTFFFEIMPDHYRYGMGFSRPNTSFMLQYRNIIEQNPEIFIDLNKLLATFSAFKLMGQEYKRPLISKTKLPAEIMPWYQKKGELYIMASFPIDDVVFSSKLIAKIEADFKHLLPIYSMFWEIKNKIVGNDKDNLITKTELSMK